ncbi:hypothetical protein GCM10027037_25810 [Mucilaginibacter koreensis]
MKPYLLCFISCLLFATTGRAQKSSVNLITTDINHFWNAYDRMSTVKDSAQQYQLLNELYINKATPGLKAMMQARDYTTKDYIDAINRYPLFWKSLRPNTYKAKTYANAIAANVARLKALYPNLQPADIYFVIGAFRSPGTTQGRMVLIGSETAMADKHVVTQELAETLPNTAAFIKTSPLHTLVFTNVHEYVHTQQKTTVCNYLLGQCVMEGVAEFMAEKATGQASELPAIAYGEKNAERVKQAFSKQLFNASNGYWLYSNARNEFNVRDLGYYVGYAICKAYYNKAKHKVAAVKEMIELDYNNEAALSRLVDQSGYFSKPITTLKLEYENGRPAITGIKPFSNGDTKVDPAITQITLEFSAPMNKETRGFELGPLGIDHLLRVKRFIGFANDGKSATFEVEIKPNQHYQLMPSERFTNINGAPLKPYLLDITTRSN